jgi:acetyltransferase-like isoleucine patch superfamily enzyme
MIIAELPSRIRFWRQVDRIGPDIPLTHWRLYFRAAMRKLCKSKFHHFDDTAEFRPGAYAVACSKISIGKRVVIRPGTYLFGEAKNLDISIMIEDDALIGSGVHFYVANHAFDNPNLPIIDQGHTPGRRITLKRGCWIGANVTLLQGVTIGCNSVVGAGSVVTKSVPDKVVVAGIPARIIRYLDKEVP